jgi:preprotein translocase SecE subunit
MAKTRAQRKAEQRRRAAQQGDGGSAAESRAQHRTQVPESADVVEAKLAEAGAELDAPNAEAVREEAIAEAAPAAPAPSRADVGRPEEALVEEEPGDRISRRARKAEERDRRERAKASERRRAPKDAPAERKPRGRVIAFFISCWAELKRVQWPDRETLVQASAVTVLFIAVAAAYLGALDAFFNFLVQHLL